MARNIILIPARFNSSRFPGKPLKLINGQSMIARVFHNCTNIPDTEAYIVTDDKKILSHAKKFTECVLMVDDDVKSGSERIFLALQRYFPDYQLDFDRVINVQGDEPLISSNVLKKLIDCHSKENYDVMTVVERMTGTAHIDNPNIVKAVVNESSGECHFFSRSPVPYRQIKSTPEDQFHWFRHVGIYSFKPQSLHRWFHAPSSYLENTEGLEQLRVLDLGMHIGSIETSEQLIGVDCPNDIGLVEEILNESGRN